VTTNTIARWLKTVLRNSGVNTDVYSAHSTRAASTSAAAANGCTFDEIMTHVGWSNANTFATFYNKHCITADSIFSDKVLQSNNS
jgi:integrase